MNNCETLYNLNIYLNAALLSLTKENYICIGYSTELIDCNNYIAGSVDIFTHTEHLMITAFFKIITLQTIVLINTYTSLILYRI